MAFTKRGARRKILCLFCALVCILVEMACANVVLIGNNATFSFDDAEAEFAPGVKGLGVSGALYNAEPSDACNPLTKSVSGGSRSFVLIIRGACTFDEKVKNAQDAGFAAAIVYDYDKGPLISMAGTIGDIHIYAVFVSKPAGDILRKYAGNTGFETWILPSSENSAWSIMGMSFIFLIGLSAVLATCFYVRRHRMRQQDVETQFVRSFHGMRSQLVKAMPSLIFTSVLEDNCTSSTCAICLEDYNVGDKLRILPCCHKFHAICVDLWLTTQRTFCPVCKHDARVKASGPPASETTPLFSSQAPSRSSSVVSSVHSTAAVSPPIRIHLPPLSQSVSRTYSSPSNPPHARNSYRSASHSPAIHISGNTPLGTMSSYRSHTSYLASPQSLGFPLSATANLRLGSPYAQTSTNASSSYLIGSSARQNYLRHCAQSATSLSGLGSPQSLQHSYLWQHGDSEASLPGLHSSQPQRHPYLQHCGDSEASLTATMPSAQSLPGC